VNDSTPNLGNFKPLPQQLQIIKDIRKNFDYSKGTHELLLSGSVGSSKSLTLSHIVATHCVFNEGARIGIGRLALPQLKATLCQKIREHLYDTGIDYKYSESTGNFDFCNGSSIKAISWADGNLAKLGSMEFSAFAIEELTETQTSRPYDVILQRVARLPHIKENFVISATNPESPEHWAYKKLIKSTSPKVKVYYSNTFDNPYLPPSYIDTLKERLSEKEAMRMILGQWVEIDRERVYYAYNASSNFKDYDYVLKPHLPIRLMYDFNIGQGKPLSLVFSQYDPMTDHWHLYDEVIIEGQRTQDSLEESLNRGLLCSNQFIVHGDCNGRNSDTRGFKSDYDIIMKFFGQLVVNNLPVTADLQVPRSNPPIRHRHNIVNAYCLNAKNQSRLSVYRKAKTVNEGFLLTRLKNGGQYLENDADRFQHCTTAIGYGIVYEDGKKQNQGQSFKQIGVF
jgi:Phage terminase large subunit